MSMICPVCQAALVRCFSAVVLGKYETDYWQCPNCELLRTDDPYWLPEAYASAIATTDLGILQRNVCLQSQIATLLYFLGLKQGTFLDFAAGYGIFCRLMRDCGFDFYATDLHCENIFSPSFVVEGGEGKFSAITAIEVLEHVHDPLALFTDLKCRLSDSNGMILFTTLLYDGSVPGQSWWYYALETGQHISFYSNITLQRIASKLNMHCVSLGENLHIMSFKQLKTWFIPNLIGRMNPFFYWYVQRSMKSKLWSDYIEVRDSLQAQNLQGAEIK